ncbi:MAG: adenylate/guanylate cyclase domain-containing protein [Arenicellales bacterium]|nr:adenylate/guanylate cyclase domain-containing protein [Arenicellales bacterium]
MKFADHGLIASQTDPAINVLIAPLREVVRKLFVKLASPMASVYRWYAVFARLCTIPKEDSLFTRFNHDANTHSILRAIQVSPAVVYQNGNQWVDSIDGSKYLLDCVPCAESNELPPGDDFSCPGNQQRFAAQTGKLFAKTRSVAPSDRVLLTLLMTDIVGSTDKVTELGDEKWGELLQQHNRMVRRNIVAFEGTEVKTTGDGFQISFDLPTLAIRCAESIHRDLEPLGMSIRAGVHTGEYVRCGDELNGVAVHLAARIMDIGKSGETIVSSTVKDLVVGSGITFSTLGNHILKGIQNKWLLFRVED